MSNNNAHESTDYKVVTQKINELEEKQAQWTKLQTEIRNNVEKANSRIKLDIGGKIFATTKDTLTSIEGTYFYALLGSGNWKPEEDGTYFIDRNPKHFDRILDYLRTGILEVSDLHEVGVRKIMQDMDYYQIPLPQKEEQTKEKSECNIKWNSSMKGNSITLSNNNTTASISVGGSWNPVFGSTPVTSVTYQIDNRKGGNMLLGLAPKPTKLPGSYTQSGFYLNATNGKLYSQHGALGRSWGKSIQGGIVKVVYDTSQYTISFGVNGATPSAAFYGVTGDMYPAVWLYDSDTMVTLIE